MTSNRIALGVEVHGIVQGVGFRPFVYQLAGQLGLKGTVANNTTGVTIHVEGPREKIETFCNNLSNAGPPLARVTDIAIQPTALRQLPDFTIMPSQHRSKQATLIAPDVSVCDDCVEEMRDPRDRRYRYPFINCTNCGPRYTIIEDIPYDRPKTAMKHFTMCPRCRTEYENPNHRRFHAQPNACPDCGPRVILRDNHRNPVMCTDPVETAVALLKKGHILAVKGLGGFHLAADAENDQAISMLRERKGRPDKPFALMSGTLDAVGRYARVNESEAALLTRIERPIVLLEKRRAHPLSGRVAPGNRHFGAMLPYTPLHHLLLDSAFVALVMTSGNRSGVPLCIDNEDAFDHLAPIADYFLIHDRPIYQRNDDTLVRRAGGGTRFIRRARGFVPIPVVLARPQPPTLACGAEMKNTICLTNGNHAFVSQHLGEMGEMGTLEFFRETIAHLKKILKITPRLVAHDLHPDYLGTQYARNLPDVERIGIQHHHAHVVSCMAENRVSGPVIGLALDGTGYGTDGAVWGGEVLVAETGRFTRAAHLGYVPMPGGEAAIREPWRMALSYLYQAFDGETYPDNLPVLQTVPPMQRRAVREMISKQVHTPATSSLGRLFDGVAAMAGLGHTITFEGQAAMALEACAGRHLTLTGDHYAWDVHHRDGMRHIGLAPLIRQVARDLADATDVGRISRRFHRSLIILFTEMCIVLRKETGINRVVMSGGVFQNRLLFEGLTDTLARKRFEVYAHRQIPTNDGGISLGQAVAAAAMANTRNIS